MIKYGIREQALIIAGKLDALARDYDYFDYINSVEDPAGCILGTARDILEEPGTISGIMDYLQGIMDDEFAGDLADTARDLMRELFALYIKLVPAEAI